MEKKDLTSGIALVLTGAAFFAGSLLLPWKDTGYDWFGAPGLVPAILAVLIALCGLRLVIRSRKEPDFYARLAAGENPRNGSGGGVRLRHYITVLIELQPAFEKLRVGDVADSDEDRATAQLACLSIQRIVQSKVGDAGLF